MFEHIPDLQHLVDFAREYFWLLKLAFPFVRAAYAAAARRYVQWKEKRQRNRQGDDWSI